MKVPVVVIPTYWRKGPLGKNDIIYDHPTDLLNPEETISKTLQSLSKISGSFDVLVIGAPTRPSIGKEVDNKILEIIKSLNLAFTTLFFGSGEFTKLKNYIAKKMPEFLDIYSNRGYGNIRNLCLLIPHLLHYETAILIDDDEIIADSNFIEKATEFIGQVINGEMIGLILGYYRNQDGSIYLDETNVPWWELIWNKPKLMNKAFKIIEDLDSNRLIDTPFAFGGNMVINRNCWVKVAFDPLIRRGEDMDFLRNVRYSGFGAKLDRSLSIIHIPPQSKTPYITKFREDVFRFFYARAKLEKLGLKLEDFEPYPGFFLKETEGKVLLTELLYFIFHNYKALIKVKNFGELINKFQDVQSIVSDAQAFAKANAGFYINFQKRWQKFIEIFPSELPFDIIREAKTES